MKYHIIVFGCQMNISDTERVSAVLEHAGLQQCSTLSSADACVVVMCSIRQTAVDRVHGLVQKFEKIRRYNPAFKAILTGCILEKDKKIFAKGFDFMVDIKDIQNISAFLEQKSHDRVKNAPNDYLDISPKHSSQFSATIPIMTGCNNFCSYCVVPYTRLREVSRPAARIIGEIKNLVKKGYKEIWLLGQNVNSYKSGKTDFPGLLQMVNKIPGDFWIRFTSSHPKDFTDKMINVMAEGGKITPYLNLPVQSGDDDILAAMNRHYKVAQYKAIIEKIMSKIPGISLSTDIIVGFPGETKKRFQNTAKLFRDIKYDMAYINKFSPRPGTAAAKLKDDILWDEKKRREKILTQILAKTALAKNKKMIGKTTIVLIDSKGKDDMWLGKNEHYKTIKVQSHKNILGQFVCVKITKAHAFAMYGEIQTNAK